MRHVARLALAGCLFVNCATVASSGSRDATANSLQSPLQQNSTSASQGRTSELEANPQKLYQALNALRVDGDHVYTIHNIAIRRNGVALTLADGKFAFLQPLEGQVTGAVFTGRGRVFVLPPDAAERESVFRFLKVPLIDVDFVQVYLRFDAEMLREIQTQLQDDKAVSLNDPSFAENWNPVVAKVNPGLTLRVMANWLSSNPKPYLHAAINSVSAGAFDLIVDENRKESVIVGQPHTENSVPMFDVWTSFEPPNSPPYDAPFQAVQFSVETQIENDLSLNATADVDLQAKESGDRLLELELSRLLHVESVTDRAGAPLTFFQNEYLRRQEIARRGNDSLFVVLPTPAVAGNEYRLRIRYHGTVIDDAGNGVYFVGARGSWYPHIPGAPQFCSFDLHFRWPKRLSLVATGEQAASGTDGDEKTGEWKSTRPIALAGFNLGDYAALNIAGKPSIAIFANEQLERGIAAELQQRRADPSLLPPPRNALPAPMFPVILPSPSAVMKQLGGKLQNSINYFEKLNGPFPFARLDVSQIPGSFGQGWPGLLYLSTFVFLPPRAQQDAGLAELQQQEVQQLMPFHEVAHQWWGNVVAPDDYRDGWIEEAMADYLSLMYAQAQESHRPVLNFWLGRYRDALLKKNVLTDRTMESAGPLDFGYRLDSTKTPGAYNVIVYDKGAWVIHMLRMMMREPRAKNPDTRFGEFLRSVLQEHQYSLLSNADFEKAAERFVNRDMYFEGGRSLAWFFGEWVRRTGIPAYSTNYQVHGRGGKFEISGTLNQEDVPDDFTESVPLYVLPEAPRNSHRVERSEFLGRVITTGASTKFHFTFRVRPSKILIDPEHTILCKPE